jgi:hypothetical protein
MTNGDGFRAGTLDRIEEILQAAVRNGQAPGVVAAVGRGQARQVAAAGVMATARASEPAG